MTHIIAVNDQIPKGKLVISLLKEFKKSKSITFLTENELEELEDTVLLKMMEDGRKSGKANTNDVFKKLNIS